MASAMKYASSHKNLMSKVAIVTMAAMLVGCGGTGGIVDRFTTDEEERQEKRAERQKEKNAQPSAPQTDAEAIVAELRALRAELESRGVNLEKDLAEARQELARRQGNETFVDPNQPGLSKEQVLQAQLSELEVLRAELARRKQAGERKEQAISAALSENEAVYKHVEKCLSRGSDFRNAFDGTPGLTLSVNDKNEQFYQNSDRTLLILTEKERCEISFAASDIEEYNTGLVHLLEKQGGVVETKKFARITVVSLTHPRGEFRLTSGRKVIGQGGSTNFYTTITAR